MRLILFSLAAVVLTCGVSAAPSAASFEKRAADNKLVVGYWVPWGDVPVASLDMSKYSAINYGFAVTWKGASKVTDITFDR